MKKTLIALAVAASAVSGMAHAAYESSFTGGDISLSGTISTPVQGGYEGQVGSLPGLDATIEAGQTSATIPVTENVGLLALRTVQGGFTSDSSDKIANITFNGKTLNNLGTFSSGSIVTMELTAQDSSGAEIGNIVFPMQVAAVSVVVDNDDQTVTGTSLFADADSQTFWGGLPTAQSKALGNYSDAITTISNMFSDIADDFPAVTVQETVAQPKTFTAENKTFNAAYAAGINSGANITLNLNDVTTAGTEVSWTASMPVVITYK